MYVSDESLRLQKPYLHCMLVYILTGQQDHLPSENVRIKIAKGGFQGHVQMLAHNFHCDIIVICRFASAEAHGVVL